LTHLFVNASAKNINKSKHQTIEKMKSMLKYYKNFMERIFKLIKRKLGRGIKEIAKRLRVNKSLATGCLRTLRDQEYVKLRKIKTNKDILLE